MAGAGFVIIFVVAFAGLSVWSMIFLAAAAHYFVTTIVDSSAGVDEVEFAGDGGAVDWWWKPVYCVWVAGVWAVPVTALLSPFLAASPEAFLIAWLIAMWIIYPFSLLSGLYSQSWIFLLHPVMVWRMLKHFLAFGYVHVMTLTACTCCVALTALFIKGGFLWIIPAALAIPTAILFYARHWGRFAWLSLNYLPRKKKAHNPYMEEREPKSATSSRTRRVPRPQEEMPAEEEVPEMNVQEVPPDDGLRAGLPPAYPGIQVGTSAPLPAPAEDDWEADTNPYVIHEDPSQPSVHESASPPAAATAAPSPAPAPVVEQEEDEWSLDKKPYVIHEDVPPVETANGVAMTTDADTPKSVTKYYEERARQEREKKRKAEEDAKTLKMPKQSKKTPTFHKAMLAGVWPFMIYGGTLRVWGNLVFLTVVELILLMMVVRFWPSLE